MPPYLVGLDLGQTHDFSALVVVEEQPTPPAPPLYAVRVLHRWPLQTAYPVIIRQTAALMTRPPLAGTSTLLVDHTGCGRPVVDALRQTGLECLAVSLHGGDSTSHVGANYRTPKRDLVAAVQVKLQGQRLRFAEALPLTPVLTQELLNFNVKIDSATAHDSYAAWRERDHDDLVLALALAVWWGERAQLSRPPPVDLSRGIVLRRSADGPRLHRAAMWPEDLPRTTDGHGRAAAPARDADAWAVRAPLRTDGVPPGTWISTHDATYGAYVWNVTEALALVQARPRWAHLGLPQLMRQTLATARVDPAQVTKAHPDEPGLVAVYFDVSTHYWRFVVIDGNHRAVRAHQTGYPFRCYELSPGESWRVLLAYPAAVELTVYTKHLACTGNCLRSESPRLGPGLLCAWGAACSPRP